MSTACRAVTASPGRRAACLVAVAVVVAGGWYAARTGFRPAAIPPEAPEGLDPAAGAAVAEARRAVLDRPRDAAAWGNLAEVFWAHLLTTESAACAAEAHRLDPDDARWAYLLGYRNLYFDPHDAVPYLRAAEAGRCPTPGHKAAAELRLAEALLDRQDSAGAEAVFRGRVAAAPGDARARLGLGRALLARDDPAGAAAEFRAAPGSPSARRQALAQLALTARLTGDVTAAARYEKEFDPLPPDEPWADPFLVGWASRRTKDELPLNRAARLSEEGRYQDAVEVLTRAVRAAPTAHGYERLGRNQYALGDLPAAEQSLRAALALDPERVLVHETLGLVLTVKADKAGGDKPALLREALGHFDRAVAIKPDQVQSLVFKGQVQTTLGDPAAGLATLARAVDVRPDSADAHLTLLLFLEKAGRIDEARARLADAEKVIPAGDETLRTVKGRLGAGRK